VGGGGDNAVEGGSNGITKGGCGEEITESCCEKKIF
jgi:hypothetical protein